MSNIVTILSEIQKDLKAPKTQYNSFGKYKYRSAEDIFEAAKPLVNEKGLILKVSDQVKHLGDRYYVEATASLSDGDNEISASGLARESLAKKGMDESQITGAASSYARKYALQGLFALDDTQDADVTQGQEEPKKDKALEAYTKLVSDLAQKEGLIKNFSTMNLEERRDLFRHTKQAITNNDVEGLCLLAE